MLQEPNPILPQTTVPIFNNSKSQPSLAKFSGSVLPKGRSIRYRYTEGLKPEPAQLIVTENLKPNYQSNVTLKIPEPPHETQLGTMFPNIEITDRNHSQEKGLKIKGVPLKKKIKKSSSPNFPSNFSLMN